jgi:hypothetical protein
MHEQDSGIERRCFNMKEREEERWREMMIGWTSEGLGKAWRKVENRWKY